MEEGRNDEGGVTGEEKLKTPLVPLDIALKIARELRKEFYIENYEAANASEDEIARIIMFGSGGVE